MKKLSFKLKITLWYTTVMTVLVAILLTFLLSTSKHYTVSSIRERVREAVAQSAVNIEIDDGILEIDDDFQAYDNGIYLSIYDEDGEKLFGTIPSALRDLPALKDDFMQKIESGGTSWYLYALKVRVKGAENYWIRGAASQQEVAGAYRNTVILLLLAFPVFIILVGVLGYLFTNRALRPVKTLYDAAQKITTGNDLSIRLPSKAIIQNEKVDELAQLTTVFNQMLDRVEQAFLHEKQFTADASHELRTPVAVMISQAECTIAQAESLEEAKEGMSVVLQQGKKMAGLINQLLTLSRAETGKDILELEECDMSELVEMVVEELRNKAEEKHITVEMDLQVEVKQIVDEALFMRVWINLISNAIQYTRQNGRIKVTLYEQDNETIGIVADNGIGIEQVHLSRIWERFYQVDKARSHSESGNVGLGLAMVKWIIEAHGGSIIVMSEFGKGTSFTFRIPKMKKN